jgi:hypothetical protein
MKCFISISSCARDIQQGYNQAMRDTWLPTLKDYGNFDYKFFVGSGKYEGYEEGIEKTWETNAWVDQVIPKAYKQAEKTFPDDLKLKDDEIMLDVPDGYKYLSLKTKLSHQYALENGYDFVFQCFTDTYVRVHNLVESGFEKHDYVGFSFGLDYISFRYASGGAGYWLSKKATELLVSSPITHWAEDVWSGEVMFKNGIKFERDERYRPFLSDDGSIKLESITEHLAQVENHGKYTPQVMYDVHEKAKVYDEEFDKLFNKVKIL